MFCPECGKENPDINQFCSTCGESLKNNTHIKSEYRPTLFLILWGLFIILSMYLLPIFPNQVFFGYGFTTLAKTVESISSSLVRCPEFISWIFFFGWGFSVSLIVIEVTHKKEILG